MSNHAPLTGRAVVGALTLFIALGARAQAGPAGASLHHGKKKAVAASSRVSLAPRFVPGQSFRYEMEFETTNDTSRRGLATDPEGPSSTVVDWNATVRIDVLPVAGGAPGGMLLKATYEKSAANVRSDTFDPSADATSEQYRSLEGKSIEFTLALDGKVLKVSGLEDVADSEKAAQAARDWISQLGASAGAPAGGVSVGETWTSEQPASSLPIAGLAWHTESEYLGNESCHPQNVEIPKGSLAKPSPEKAGAGPDCAVILAKLSLVRAKSGHETTPPELLQQGVESTGKWTGSAQGLLYVSLDSGLIVSSTQTGSEEMDVTFTSNHKATLRYKGTISTRLHVVRVSEK